MAESVPATLTKTEKRLTRRFYTSTVFHFLCLSHHLTVQVLGLLFLLSIRNNEHDKVRELFNFAPAFATNWNFLFQTTFLSLALLHDALEWVDKHDTKIGRLVRYWRDVVFSGLAIPITMFVTGMFWSVYLIDRELVFPTVYDDIVPWWFNHCVHTNIFIIICVETVLVPRRRPVDSKMEHVCVITAVVAYAVV
ncbi:unnamed protein product [Plutella xylostella]|uniref:(diamondback moth) hypothetical protein n=1 Tax=Plutella xylostella TaxID=51655 RepID=A0A8S4G3S8_PLUXY|nr:unnamed protein product [Plutella xylostella]